MFSWWFLYAPDGPQMSWWELTHFMQCTIEPGKFAFMADGEWTCSVFGDPHPMTMALSVLVTIEMLNALNSVSENQSLFVMPPTQNPLLCGAIALSMSLHFVILYVDPMPMVFNICPLTASEWWVVMKISLPVLVSDEAMKYIAREYVEKAEQNALKKKK